MLNIIPCLSFNYFSLSVKFERISSSQKSGSIDPASVPHALSSALASPREDWAKGCQDCQQQGMSISVLEWGAGWQVTDVLAVKAATLALSFLCCSVFLLKHLRVNCRHPDTSFKILQCNKTSMFLRTSTSSFKTTTQWSCSGSLMLIRYCYLTYNHIPLCPVVPIMSFMHNCFPPLPVPNQESNRGLCIVLIVMSLLSPLL